MKKAKLLVLSAALVSIVGLSGCATTSHYGDTSYNGNYRTNSDYNRVYGTITHIERVQISHRDYNGPGIGMVAGAVIGGILGNQIGSGSGRALATAGGAVAGGYAGNRIEQNTAGSRWADEVTVVLDNGDRVRVVQPSDGQLYKGARVYISGSGSNARVIIR